MILVFFFKILPEDEDIPENGVVVDVFFCSFLGSYNPFSSLLLDFWVEFGLDKLSLEVPLVDVPCVLIVSSLPVGRRAL